MTTALGHAEPIPLDRAIRLALTHGTSTAIANADMQRAFASYRELRNKYFPQLVVGSGLGWSYGYPLTIEGSAPALAMPSRKVRSSIQRRTSSSAQPKLNGIPPNSKAKTNAMPSFKMSP